MLGLEYSLRWEQLELLYVSEEAEQSPHLLGRGARGDVRHLNDVRAGVHFREYKRASLALRYQRAEYFSHNWTSWIRFTA